jgi:hypothetical protein
MSDTGIMIRVQAAAYDSRREGCGFWMDLLMHFDSSSLRSGSRLRAAKQHRDSGAGDPEFEQRKTRDASL